MAKRNAAYRAVIELYKKKLLNEEMKPIKSGLSVIETEDSEDEED